MATGGLSCGCAQKRAVIINHKAVLRLMNRLGIHSMARQRKVITKMSQLETYHRYENVLNRDFQRHPAQPKVGHGYYLHPYSAGLGLPIHDQRPVRWLYRGTCHEPLQLRRAGHPNRCEQAQDKEKVTDGLILHSDQGQQYTSHAYHVLTQQYNITPSMSRRGNCWDNAPMENFFGHLKEEALRNIQNSNL